MLTGGMARDEIEQHMQAVLMGCFKQLLHVFVGAIARRNGIVIGNIIAGIPERRGKAGIQPDSTAAKAADIVQLLDNALQVADAICIGIAKALRVNFIKDCLI